MSAGTAGRPRGEDAAQRELEALTAEYAASRLRWEAAVDAAGIGSFLLDLATGALDWDERMQELFGYAPGEFRAHLEAGFERVHPDDRAAVEAAVAEAVAATGEYAAGFRVVLPDGRVRHLAARGRATPGPGGAPGTLVGAAWDVTALRTARDEAARLLETMVTGFVALDRDWRITYVNQQGARTVGRAAEDLVGRVLWEAFPRLEEHEFGRLYLESVRTGRPVEAEAWYDHLGGWFHVHGVPTDDGLSLYFTDVTERHRDQERAEAAAARLRLLSAVSAELADAGFDVEGAVARLARLVVPALADWALVSLADGRELHDVGVWHRDPALRPVAEAYVAHRLLGRSDMGAVDQARRTRRPVVVESGVTDTVVPTLGDETARSTLQQLAPESVVVVPLLARGHMTGVLTLLRGADRVPMPPEELETAVDIAARAALALDNARLFDEQRGLAEGLQRSLLTTPPQPDHCHIAVRYVPAARAASVGGDWYDAFLQRDGATVLVIGDVMGHDTAAAAAMGQLRGLARGIAWHSGGAPAEVLRSLDDAVQGLQIDTTATAVVARLEEGPAEAARGVRVLRWSNAGHPPPLVVEADGTVRTLGGSDLLLGLDPGSPRRDEAVELGADTTVVFYTDGLVERRGQDLDDGLELLRTALSELAGAPLERLCDALLERLLPADADDDVALVAVRLLPEDRPRPPEAGPEVVPPGR